MFSYALAVNTVGRASGIIAATDRAHYCRVPGGVALFVSKFLLLQLSARAGRKPGSLTTSLHCAYRNRVQSEQ